MRNYNNLPQEVITLVAGRTGQEKAILQTASVWKPFRVIGERKAMMNLLHRLYRKMNHDDSVYVKLPKEHLPNSTAPKCGGEWCSLTPSSRKIPQQAPQPAAEIAEQ